MDDFTKRLTAIVGPAGLLTGAALAGRAPGFGRHNLGADVLVRPADTAQVSAVLRLCHAEGRPVVTQGGLTGLVDGAASRLGDLILSTERLNAIEAVDPLALAMTVGAGAVLQTVQEEAERHGLFYPVDLGARASCTIGGTIATNAGGMRVLRYGMTREAVLGLEAVLADGTVLSNLTSIIKNNTGYDLKHLLVGSEGTLGVVTRATLRLRPLPTTRQTALVAVPSFAALVGLLNHMVAASGGSLASFEALWPSFYAYMCRHTNPGAPPLVLGHAYYAVIEALGGDEAPDRARFEAGLERALGLGLVADAVIAKSDDERRRLWRIRDDTMLLERDYPAMVNFDVSLPLGRMEGYVTDIARQLAARFPRHDFFVFGHLGDGNLHFELCGEPLPRPEIETVERIVYDRIGEVGGSVSAEHGIGLEKKPYLDRSRGAPEIAAMRAIRRALDPKGILNPGKLFD
jgi:FAD/FMN-containing dehydrogenase